MVKLAKGVQDVVRAKQVAHTHRLGVAQRLLRRVQYMVKPGLSRGECLIGYRIPRPNRGPRGHGGWNCKAIADGQIRDFGEPCRQQGRRRMVGDQHIRPYQRKHSLPGVQPSGDISRFSKTTDTQHVGVVHRRAAASPRLRSQGRGQHGNTGRQGLSCG